MSERAPRASFIPALQRLALVVPIVAVTFGACLAALAARAGVSILAEAPPRNPSEAAIRRDLPVLAEYRQGGTDLRQRHELTPRYTEFEARAATPLEAAVLSGSADVVRFVVRAAPPLAEEREKAACLAIDIGADEGAMTALLDGAPRPACTPGAALMELRQSR